MEPEIDELEPDLDDIDFFPDSPEAREYANERDAGDDDNEYGRIDEEYMSAGESGKDSVNISVSAEFYKHYRKITYMRDRICSDVDAKDSSKATILSVTTSALKDLIAMQERLHNSESYAQLQQAVVSVLKSVSPELRDKVMKKFEEKLSSC